MRVNLGAVVNDIDFQPRPITAPAGSASSSVADQSAIAAGAGGGFVDGLKLWLDPAAAFRALSDSTPRTPAMYAGIVVPLLLAGYALLGRRR